VPVVQPLQVTLEFWREQHQFWTVGDWLTAMSRDDLNEAAKKKLKEDGSPISQTLPDKGSIHDPLGKETYRHLAKTMASF
jgi:hypothetical protein